jgi:hypothetical protein
MTDPYSPASKLALVVFWLVIFPSIIAVVLLLGALVRIMLSH